MKDLRVATPDGLRRSAFMEGFALRTRVSGTVDLKAVGRKLSGEGFASCDTGRLAPFRFYGRVRCANEGVRKGGLESGLGASPPVKDLRAATPDGSRRSAFREGFAVRKRVSGTDQCKRVRKDRTMKRVRPEGFEPSTLGSEDRCAIQLRHGRITNVILADAVQILKGGNRQLEKP